MRTLWRNDRERQRGASLVEFALTVPLLLLLVAGVADLGRAFTAYITITNASREGARMAARNPTDVGAIQEAVILEAVPLEVTADDIEILMPEGSGSGKPVTVGVEHDFPLILGGLLGLPGGSLRLNNRTTMVIY